MYLTLMQYHGKQLGLCEEAIKCSMELYGAILVSKLPTTYRRRQELEEMNDLISALNNLHKCLIEADIAVEEIAIG